MKKSKIIIMSMAGLFILILVVGLLLLKSYLKSVHSRHDCDKKTGEIVQIYRHLP